MPFRTYAHAPLDAIAKRPPTIGLAVLMAGLCVSAGTIAQVTPRDVLVLFSNNRLLPANIEVDRAMRERIARTEARPVEVFQEFLDRPTFSGEAFDRNLATYLHEKYADRPPRAIVVIGDPALNFILFHRPALFPGTPVVHVGIDKAYVQTLRPTQTPLLGVPVEYDFRGTVEQALRWHPDTRRLLVITGTSPRDRIWEAKARAEFADLAVKPAMVEYLAGLSAEALKARLRGLGAGDLVFSPGYYRDGTGRDYSPRDAIAEIAAASTGAPVYGPFSAFIGTGIVGGRMPANRDMGRLAADAINALLDGVAPQAVAQPAVLPAVLQVDWRQVRRWGIAEADIPPDAAVFFKEPTFWDLYRTQALLAMALFLIQALLIAALFIERRRRRHTALALERSEDRMSLAARASRLSTWSWDVDRTPPGASAEASSLDEVLDTVHPADREDLHQAAQQAVERDQELDVEYRVVEPGGEVRWIAARGRAEKDGGKRITGVALDITARKEAELQAQKDRSALTHMTRVSMLGQLSASIAHQLNQPLAAILGNAEAARKMLGKAPLDLVELRAICDDIISEDRRAAEVIRRLGALFKRGEMTLAPLDLNELVSETLELVRTELTTRHVEAATEFAPGLALVDGGRVQLQQVLLNLILNAADAMVDIAPESRRLVVRTEMRGTDVRLCVIDQGCGIAAADMPHLFDPFWSTKPGGTGMGLAICRSIVEGHRGTLTVANTPDGGAAFCATWPARQTA
ncbi:PAS domain-containing sensor histidine kinase [Variovorax sp. J31P207]|uniref:sensor histidine kinase n=1 Tax=Variovorax sp. J31P207 TaxID=3053510 RepID=UPI002574CBF0|nr:PAS domain-containing sensor histidine kinase [Variovorax sp. J31P207]MDM0065110.1 ATP-binding protein [Variovorax sp. J31P207]